MGDVNRYASGYADWPGDGGPARLGIFRTIDFGRKEGTKNYASHGETFVCAIEFAGKQNAQCSMSYGNSTRPGSVFGGSIAADGGQKAASGVEGSDGDRAAFGEAREILSFADKKRK